MNELYVTYRGRYVRSRPDGTGYYVPKRGKDYSHLTDNVLLGHIDKAYSLCIFSGIEHTKFVCFDVDKNPLDNVWKVMTALEKAGIPETYVHVSNSGGKGYHVEIFFNDTIRVSRLKRLYEFVLDDSGLSSVDVEFRPTHTQSIKLPLSRHPKTNRMCWFVEKDTLKEIETAEYIFSIRQMSSEDMEAVIDALPVREQAPALRPQIEGSKVHYGSLIVDELPVLGDAGERHRLMLLVGTYAVRKGLNAAEVEAFIHEWYSQQDKSFAKTEGFELDSDIRNIAAWCSKCRFFDGYYYRKDGKISKEDMDWILSYKERMWRRLLYLITVGGAKHGGWTSSYERIALMVGGSVSGVRKALNSLVEAGAVKVEQGKVKVVDGAVKRTSNVYRVLREAVVTDADFDRPEVVNVGLNESYFTAIESIYQGGVKRVLTPKDYKDYKEWKNGKT